MKEETVQRKYYHDEIKGEAVYQDYPTEYEISLVVDDGSKIQEMSIVKKGIKPEKTTYPRDKDLMRELFALETRAKALRVIYEKLLELKLA